MDERTYKSVTESYPMEEGTSKMLRGTEDLQALKKKIEQVDLELCDRKKLLSKKKKDVVAKIKELNEIEEISKEARMSIAKSVIQTRLMMVDDIEKGNQTRWDVEKLHRPLNKLNGETEDLVEVSSKEKKNEGQNKKNRNKDEGGENVAT
ncbi:hypothetical protein L1887_01195 [Cichorium endivia]|nr:hypothetical protein L1887_01195 [Cichorium endivia]